MKKRIAVLATLVAVVAVAVPSNASGAVKPKGGTWKGKTVQGTPVEFTVKKKSKGWKVVRAEFTVRWTCSGTFPGGSLPPETSETTRGFPVINLSTGKPDSGNIYEDDSRLGIWQWFHSGGFTSPEIKHENSQLMRGEFLSKRKAKGFANHQVTHTEPGISTRCNSGRVKWTAKKK